MTQQKLRFCEKCWLDRKQQVAAKRHVDDRDLCGGCVREEGYGEFEGVAIASAASVPPPAKFATPLLVPSTGPRIAKETKEAAMPKEKNEPKFCACGKKLYAKAIALGQCKDCREGGKKPSDGGASPRKKRATTAGRRKPAPVRWEPSGKVTIAVSEAFLESAWLRLTPELKGIAIAAALEA